MRGIRERDFFAAGKNPVAPMLFIPLRNRGVLVHVFNYVAPADTGVVGAETNLAFLRAVGNDAHFSATEVVVE